MFQNYKNFWDNKAETMQNALIAVDGSVNEDVARLTGAYSAEQVKTALELTSTDRVLELGCGVGRIGRELAEHVHFWQGVDISANMIHQARERLKDFPNIGLSELSRTSLDEFADHSFDKAYCIAVFIHMDKEDFFLYLKELFRVLKPGGRLFFDTWNLISPTGWRRWSLEVQQYTGADPSVRKDVARNQFSTPQEVSMYVQQAGFEELGQWSDSPWIQTLAVKPDVRANLANLREQANRQSDHIVYSPLWTALFNKMIDVTVGMATPGEIWHLLSDDNQGKEIPMFRAWFLGMWRNLQTHWGPLPEEK